MVLFFSLEWLHFVQGLLLLSLLVRFVVQNQMLRELNQSPSKSQTHALTLVERTLVELEQSRLILVQMIVGILFHAGSRDVPR